MVWLLLYSVWLYVWLILYSKGTVHLYREAYGHMAGLCTLRGILWWLVKKNSNFLLISWKRFYKRARGHDIWAPQFALYPPSESIVAQPETFFEHSDHASESIVLTYLFTTNHCSSAIHITIRASTIQSGTPILPWIMISQSGLAMIEQYAWNLIWNN